MRLRLNADKLVNIESYCDRQLASSQFAGISWRIRSQEHCSGTRVHGYSNHELTQPLESNSIYRLYSMTKPVISILCLMLVEKGLLQFADPVSRWIPTFKSQQVLNKHGELVPLNREVTIEDLLTHRAGLSYDFIPDCAIASEYRRCRLAEDGSRSLAELVRILGDLPLAFQPGRRWYYSYATDVLAHVLECVSQQPLRMLLRDLIFAPLDMQDTDFQVKQNDRSRLAAMFGQRVLGEVADDSSTSNHLKAMSVEESYPSDRGDTFSRGGIGLFSTIDDYLEFMHLLGTGCSRSGETLLSKTMLDFMWSNRLSAEQMPIRIGQSAYPGYGWGLAGRVMCNTAQAMYLTESGEGGWAGAASTYFWVDRNMRFSGIVMAQYLGSAVALGPEIQSLSYASLE